MTIPLDSPVKSKQTITNASAFFILTFICVISCPLSADELPEEPKATLNRLLDACVKPRGFASGKGIALINTLQQDGSKKILSVEFWLDHTRRARSDFYSVQDNRKNRREAVWATGSTGTIHYDRSQSRALIDPNTVRWQINPWKKYYTFNPRTFIGGPGLNTYGYIESLLYVYPRQGCFITTNDKGVVYIDANDCDSDSCTRKTFSINTINGFQLTHSSTCIDKFNTPERSYSKFRKLEWSNSPSSSYVTSAQYHLYDGFYPTHEEAIDADATLKISIEITILEFDPWVEINDSDFELSGLDLPVNTLVHNYITGEEYVIQNNVIP